MAKRDTTDRAPARPVTREVSAVSTTDGAFGASLPFVGPLLLPTDKVLRARGGDYAIYEDVLRDDQVHATLQQRRLAVVSREVVVEAGGDRPIDREAAEALEDNIKAIGWDRIYGKMHYGVFYGYAVAECMWGLTPARAGGRRRVVLEDVLVRKRQRFRFDRERKLRLLRIGEPTGVVMPDRKFWTFVTGADNDDEPYGLGLGHWLFWPVFFKKNNLRFWLVFLEKFGQPTGLGHYPPNATDEERGKLLEAVQAVATEAGIVVPEGFEITLLEAARRGSADYRAMLADMNAAISKVVLSQTMTTDPGSSRAQSETHMDVRDEVVKGDADLIDGSFNCGPAVWLTQWNFPGAVPPRVWRRVESEPDLKPVAERDLIISQMGFRPTPAYIRETYGEGWVPAAAPARSGADDGGGDGDPEDEDGDAGGGTAFADPLADTAGPAGPLAAQLGAAAQPEVNAIVDRIFAMAQTAGSLEELREMLIAAFPRVASDRLGGVLERGLAAAMAAGRFDTSGRDG